MAKPGESHSDYVERMQLKRRQVMKAFALGGSAGVATFLINSCAGPAATPTAVPEPTKPAAAPTTAPAAPTATTAAAPTATTAAAAPTVAAPTATTAPKPTVAPTAATTPVPTAPPTDATALRLVMTGEPDTHDPSRGSFVDEIACIMRVFSNTYRFDTKSALVPEMADGMPTVSADGKTITIKLKKGILWSDGQPVLAKHFVYGAQRQLNPVVAGEYAYTLYPIAGATEYNGADPTKTDAAGMKKLRDAVGVKAADDSTVVYTLADQTPWFMSVFGTWNGLPLREDIVTAGGKPEENQDWVAPATYIGNGPFKMTKHEANVQFVFEANDKYVRGVPPVKKVQYVIIRDTTVAFAAFEAGQLDRAGVTSLVKARVDSNPTLKAMYQTGPDSCTFYLGFNNTVAPFDKKAVRQAFSYAVDRKTFTEQVMKGLGLAAEQFLPPGFPGYYPEVTPKHTFDAAKAKSLLASAGFANGAGLPPIKYTFSNSDTNKLYAGALQAMFKTALNVDVTLDPVESKAFTALVKDLKTTPQMFLLGWCQDYPDPQNWYSTVFQSSSTVSHTGWKNADFDKLTTDADKMPDRKAADAKYLQAANILQEETPVAFLFNRVVAFLLRPEVTGYVYNPLENFFGQSTLYEMKLNR